MHAQFRPQWHFTPPQGWANDPNGLIYTHGQYHLFYQHHPNDTVWGPMHWGHAVSRDLVAWQHLPIALYPDDQGMIFSGSAVEDTNNTSGMGAGTVFAIYTYHRDAAHGAESIALATSQDGLTFTPYPGNPILPNPGVDDFRDPKVIWDDRRGQWVMALAVGDHVAFYTSPNLLVWQIAGRFYDVTASPGVWECPDFFPMQTQEGVRWVLIVSHNPGRQEGGSKTTYYVGNFDGQRFVAEQPWKLLDIGPDCYAGVTFANEPSGRRILVAWMNNWVYANEVPTGPFRGSMTLPRRLTLRRGNVGWVLVQQPMQTVNALRGPCRQIQGDHAPLPSGAVDLLIDASGSYEVELSNALGERLCFGEAEGFYLDRTQAGISGFDPDFAGRYEARRGNSGSTRVRAIWDHGLLELYVDGGAQTLSAQAFPTQPYDRLTLRGNAQAALWPLTGR